jgi:hypothetical protein
MSTKKYGAAVAAAVLALGVGVPLAAAAPAGATTVTVTSHFVWSPPASDVVGDTAYISNGATNGHPNDLLFATPNWNANGLGGEYLNEPIGVWYNTSNGDWALFTENETAMPDGESFNVLVVPKSSKSAFVWRSTASNTTSDFTLINSKLTNGKPDADLQVTQNWDPGGHGGVYNAHNIGVWYDKSKKKWGIFNEDRTAMATGLAFNVLVGSAVSNGGKAEVLKTTHKNRVDDTVFFTNGETTGNPNNVTFVTENWNPGGKGGTYNNQQMGVWYDGAEEGVFDESGSVPPIHSAYNLLIFSS